MGARVNNARIVNDQLPVQHDVATVKAQIHEVERQLDERAFYPAHDARTESAAYAKVHRHLCVDLDLPCLACGVKHSTLLSGAAENPFGAKAMETHHHIVEWALANAISTEQFNKTLLPNLAHAHPNDPTWAYETPFDDKKVKDWVDHSEHNLWVLCDVHHRHPFLGIHEISYPIWCPQNLLRADFAKQVHDQLMGDGNEAPAKG